MKISDMMTSKYLKKEDVGRGLLVTVKGIARANVALDGEQPEYKYTMLFHETEKPLVLNSTNIQLAAQALGGDDTDQWVGKKLVLYTDPNVSFQGKLIGGIRVRAPRPGAVSQTLTNPAPAPSAAPEADDDIPW